MPEKRESGQAEPARGPTREAARSQRPPELPGDFVEEDTDLRLALERWEGEGGS